MNRLRVIAAPGFALILLALLFPAAGKCSGLDDIEFSSDIRLRWRWVDSGSPGPLRSTYGEAIQRGISLKHRFIFELEYPLSAELRIGGLVRASNEPQLVLRAGPEYYSSEFGSAFISYDTPWLTSRFGYFETYCTPLTLMRWDLKDDAEGGGCQVCGVSVGTAGAILGESLEMLGPVLTFEGIKAAAFGGDLLGLDVFYARPRVAYENEFGSMSRQLNTFGARLDLSTYISRASDLMKVGLIAMTTKEDDGSVESLEGPPAYPPKPFTYSIYGLSLQAPILRWLSLTGEANMTRASEWELVDPKDMDGVLVDRDGKGALGSLDVKAGAVNFETAYIYLTPDWKSFFRALSYSPDRKGPRFRLTVERGTWLFSVFARDLVTVNRISETEREAYRTWSLQASYKPRTGMSFSGSVVYTGLGSKDGAFDYTESGRLYSYVFSAVIEIARDTRLIIEDRYLHNRDYRVPEFNYEANMLSLFLKAAIW